MGTLSSELRQALERTPGAPRVYADANVPAGVVALLRQIGFLLLLNAALPLLIPNIAWEAHLGGLIGGFVIGELWSRVDNEAGRIAVTVAVAALAVVTVMVVTL